MSSLANLEGEMDIIAFLNIFIEASVFTSSDMDSECGNSLKQGQEGDEEDGDILDHDVQWNKYFMQR